MYNYKLMEAAGSIFTIMAYAMGTPVEYRGYEWKPQMEMT
jgi:hypothetical protein